MSAYTSKVKRFFGLTSINLNGLLLICLTSNLTDVLAMGIVYLFIYNLSLYCFFYCFSDFITDEKDKSLVFSDFYNIFENHDLSKIILTAILLILSGLPPFVLFFYKFVIFLGLMAVHSYFIIFIVIVLNLFGFFYYLNIIKDI
jgi:NADH:ubiquinone oxidoreductase subunit 2 (subunit N)